MVVATTHNSESDHGRSRQRGLVSKRVQLFQSPVKSTNEHIQFGMEHTSSHCTSKSVPSRCNQPDTSFYASRELIDSGVAHYNQGDFQYAFNDFTLALKTLRVSGEQDGVSVAVTLGNLGAVYLQTKQYAAAEKVLLESFSIKSRLQPQGSMADTLNNLGNCSNLRGDTEKSLQYYELALMDLKLHSGKPADVANALFNIGRIEIQRQDLDAALSVLSDAYKMTKDAHGENHAFVAQTLDLIGFVQLSSKDYDAANVSFTKAMGIFRRLYGPLHVDVANSLFNVSMVREAKGELADAWESYTTTRDLYSRLKTRKDHARYKICIDGIQKIEATIAKYNQERLVAK
jgi:tetratricopeptide (TPR) repeat protein